MAILGATGGMKIFSSVVLPSSETQKGFARSFGIGEGLFERSKGAEYKLPKRRMAVNKVAPVH